MTGPTIGPATPDDAGELARLRWELYAEQEDGVDESLDAYRSRFEPFARAALASDEWRAWVARDGERIVGAMWLRTIHRVPVPGMRAGPIGYVTNVYVEPPNRDRGLGATMLVRLLEHVRAEAFSELIVWPTERSRAFYGRGGFARLDEPLSLRVVDDVSLGR
jgi:GNAT superfamily N-acetyltransferase